MQEKNKKVYVFKHVYYSIAMYTETVLKIFRAKLLAKDNYERFSITPDIDTFNSNGAIKDARGYGIPIACYADTSDKLVITPKHMGYDFNYVMGEGSWGRLDERLNFDKVNTDLFYVGRELCKEFIVWFVSINMTEKGYDDSYAVCLNDTTETAYKKFLKIGENKHFFKDTEIVLFVFGLTIDTIKQTLDKITPEWVKKIGNACIDD